MSSLMQFQGETGQRGVRLEFVLRESGAAWDAPPLEPVECPTCGQTHERIHVAWRRPAGMFGQFVVFRYLGAEHVPDMSIPIDVTQLPHGAVALDDAETCAAWHRR